MATQRTTSNFLQRTSFLRLGISLCSNPWQHQNKFSLLIIDFNSGKGSTTMVSFQFDETKPPKELDISIEQMKPLEQRLGISIDNVTIEETESGEPKVFFEIRVLNGGKLEGSMHIFFLAYGESGKIVGRASGFLSSKNVFAFSSGSERFWDLPADRVKKIVIYPELS